MNTNEPKSIEQENTDRIIARAASLGYEIRHITPDGRFRKIAVEPLSMDGYTPWIDGDFGEFNVNPVSHSGGFTIDELEKVAEGYQRAAALIRELEATSIDNLVEYHAE